MGRPALSSPEVISRLASVGLEPLEPYIHSETPLLMRCIRCGHKTRKTPLLAFVGKGCRKCAYRDLRLTVQEILKGADAYEKEQGLLHKYAAYRYCGQPVLKCGGNMRETVATGHHLPNNKPVSIK